MTAVERSVEFPGPASPALTMSPLRRGGGDPCYLVTPDGAIWRTSLMRSGPVTARTVGPSTVTCQAWEAAQRNSPMRCPHCLG